MKFTQLAIACFVGSAQAGQSLTDLVNENVAKATSGTGNANILTGDFLTGFESGIFLREKPDQIKEYGCPKAQVEMEEFKKVKEMLPAVTTMLGIMKQDDAEMKNMLESLTIFVNHLDELIGVFDAKYTGGDFCAGLTFGQAGSNLLYNMASVIIHENIKQYKKKSETLSKMTGTIFD